MRGGRIRNAKRKGRESLLNLKEKIVLGVIVAGASLLACVVIVPGIVGALDFPSMILAIASGVIAMIVGSSCIWGRSHRKRGQ